MSNKTSDYKSFSYLEDGSIQFSQYETIKSVSKLDPGCYKIGWLDYPENKTTLNIDNDNEKIRIHTFPDKEKLDRLFEAFFNKETLNHIIDLGFNHKVGVLLYGIEGTGKSTICKYYYNKAINEHNALVFLIPSSIAYSGFIGAWDFIQNVRKIQDNPIIVMLDEIDEHIKDHANFIKTMIDGYLSINNCIFLACTNHIDVIPEALKNRPSRFKYSLNIEGIQVESEVYDIVYNLLGSSLEEEKLKEITKELKGSTLDYIKQYCFDKIMDLNHYGKKVKKIGFL